MEPIQTFEEVLMQLENKQIIMFFSPLPTYCIKRESRIELISKKSRMLVSSIDFIELYSNEVFFIHEVKEENDIDTEKDNEYYGLRYK